MRTFSDAFFLLKELPYAFLMKPSSVRSPSPFYPLRNPQEASPTQVPVLGLQIAFPLKLQWQVGGAEEARCRTPQVPRLLGIL